MIKSGQPHSDIQPQGLHYHQLAGVHAVIRKVFSNKPTEGPCPGILLADEVGLEKMAMAISLMALVLLQASEVPLPLIIGKASSLTKLISLTVDFFFFTESLPYLGDVREVTCLPHLVIAPGTLGLQWEAELTSWFQAKKIDILSYGNGKEAHRHF